MSVDNRNNFWVEDKVQGALVRRLIIYWIIAWLWIVGLTFLANFSYSYMLTSLTAGEIVAQAFGLLWLPVLVSMVVLPIIIRDYVKLSHRICGPLVKFRRVVKQLCDGDQPQPIQLRKKDYWQDLTTDINRMIALLPIGSQARGDDCSSDERMDAIRCGESVAAEQEVLAEQT